MSLQQPMIISPCDDQLALDARDYAVVLVRQAMQLLRDSTSHASAVVSVKAPGDVSSDIDRNIEAFFKQHLYERFPEHRFLGEEAGGKWPAHDPVWLVDPIDGTLNFVHGYPQYSISVALVVAGRPIAACVADPSRNEIFSAARGHGAQLNGQSIRVAETPSLIEALAATVFPKPKAVFMTDYLTQLGAVMRELAGVRRSGSMALEMAYLAAGRCDVFWERGMGPWDAAAGLLLIEEAGGLVFSLDGQPILTSQHIAASIPSVAARWRSLLNGEHS